MAGHSQSFLDPAFLSQLDNYALVSKIAVEGYLSGMHRSLLHGLGTEFVQYRNYTPGEDLKYLDWKVLAKSDRLYTKVFEEETNLNCYIVIDTSASHDYQGTRASCTKLKYACMIAACIAYLATKQGDNIGLYAYSDQFHEVMEPGHRAGQLHRCLQALSRLQATGRADHTTHIGAFNHLLKGAGLVIYISDMLESESTLPKLINQFRFLHCDCMALQVLDFDEEHLPQPSVTRYIDSETASEIITYPEATRDHYEAAIKTFLETLKDGFSQSQIDYIKLNTHESLGFALAKYLSHRERGR